MLENSPENVAAEQKYGIGSPFWTAGTAISGALAGLTGGDMSQALAGGLAPYLSLAVKAATTDAKGNVNQAENITGHALAGAVVAYLQGGSVTGGAAGAATGELAAQLIAKELYPGVKPENLTNEQKANVSALSTLAAGLAGGVAGNSSVAAGTGGIAGKTAVENNSLSGDNARAAVKESAEEMKAHVREKMGENLASQLTNGVLNAVSETVDLALAGGDTVLDAAMALVSCATGDRYCNTAISDLGKKDQAAGNVLNSLVNGDAWAAIQNTAIKASQGDQVALEKLAGILTGIVVPSSKVPFAGKGGSVIEETVTANTGKTSSGAENAANASKLNTQLSAQEIANGHAFEKHVLQRGEFNALGIRTRAQFEQHVENVINNPTDVRYYNDGRVAYLDSTTRTVVIRNPGKGESTAFRPDYDIGWDNYIKRLPTQNTPPMN